MTGLNQFLTDVPILAGTVCCGRCHNETRSTVFIQIGVEIGDPQIVGVAEFLFGVDRGQAERQTPRTLGGLGIDLVHIEWRIGHDIVAAAVQIVGVVIEGICFVAGLNDTVEPVNSHIHQAELGIVLHFFLSIKGHGGIGFHPGGIDKITGLNKHPTAAAGGVQKDTAGWFQYIDDHLDQGFGREEHTIVLGDVFGKLIEEVLIDAANDIAAHLVQRTVVEDAKKFCQQFVREHGVVLRQHTDELLRLDLH